MKPAKKASAKKAVKSNKKASTSKPPPSAGSAKSSPSSSLKSAASKIKKKLSSPSKAEKKKNKKKKAKEEKEMAEKRAKEEEKKRAASIAAKKAKEEEKKRAVLIAAKRADLGEDYNIREVPLDGQCLFTAWSYHEYKNLEHSDELRKLACKTMKNCTFFPFRHFLVDGETPADHIRKMSRKTTWAGEAELLALCINKRQPAVVHSPFQPNQSYPNYHDASQKLRDAVDWNKTSFHFFHSGNHWEPLTPKNDESSESELSSDEESDDGSEKEEEGKSSFFLHIFM